MNGNPASRTADSIGDRVRYVLRTCLHDGTTEGCGGLLPLLTSAIWLFGWPLALLIYSVALL